MTPPRSLPPILAWLAALSAAACGDDAAPITIQGESPASTNIPSARDPRASGGAYLALDTADAPAETGWFARYDVDVPSAGVYRVDAVLTGVAMADRTPRGGSPFEIAVNGAPFAQLVRSEIYWGYPSSTPEAWGALVRARLDDVELREGHNEIAFRVVERRTGVEPAHYVFALDELTVTPTPVALVAVHVGDPAATVGVYRDESALLTLRLNGTAHGDVAVSYRIVDHRSRRVAEGTATIAAGSRGAAVALSPGLAPGNYRVTASIGADRPVRGAFARLPAQSPVRGPASRFSVTVSSPWLLPSSRRAAVAAALSAAGAGYARDEIYWPTAEAERGRYDTRELDATARAFRAHGLKSLGTLWTLMGDLVSPAWAITPDTDPMPLDLRDAYHFLQYLADKPDGVGADALEVWNEPDVDVSEGLYAGEPADAHAAYVKAAALGVVDSRRRPLVALSGVADASPFHRIMLQSDIVRYADIWAYHGYGFQVAPADTVESDASSEHDFLRRTYVASTQMWMTEMGIFFLGREGQPFTYAKQIEQAQYLVQSSVTQLATGADKLFWFCATPYGFSGEFGSFGLLGPDFEPWPSYSAYAAMTAILGEARFAHAVSGLPAGVQAYVFRTGDRAVTVVWADTDTDVEVPVPGALRAVHDIMGAPLPLAATLTATADPIYLVSDGGADLRARPVGDDERRVVGELTEAEHIVLSQRFAADTAPASPPFGYAVGEATAMSLDVYNFNRVAKIVTVSPRAWAGWSVRAGAATTVTVEPMGRATLPFEIVAGDDVVPVADYPLVFEATVDGHRVSPSVARVYLRGDDEVTDIPLEPIIAMVSPPPALPVHGDVRLVAVVADAVSGVDPARVSVTVDGAVVASQFDETTGLLTATLALPPGRHVIAVRAWNHAHAPSMVLRMITVAR